MSAAIRAANEQATAEQVGLSACSATTDRCALVTVADEHTIVMAYSEGAARGVAPFATASPAWKPRGDRRRPPCCRRIPNGPQGLVQWVDICSRTAGELNTRFRRFRRATRSAWRPQVSASG
jgi:hypothetical protein